MRKSAAPVPRFLRWNLRIGFLALLMVLPPAAGAQIQLRCHEDRAFHPTDKSGQPKFNDVDLNSPVTSDAPDIATGKGGRVGIGTDGGIEISAQGKDGDATLTYQVKDRSTGQVTTVNVKVHVNCRQPTHRQTNCRACKSKAEKLNAAIDKLAKAQAAGNKARAAALEKEISKLTEELDECERKKCPEKKNDQNKKGEGKGGATY